MLPGRALYGTLTEEDLQTTLSTSWVRQALCLVYDTNKAPPPGSSPSQSSFSSIVLRVITCFVDQHGICTIALTLVSHTGRTLKSRRAECVQGRTFSREPVKTIRVLHRSRVRARVCCSGCRRHRCRGRGGREVHDRGGNGQRA